MKNIDISPKFLLGGALLVFILGIASQKWIGILSGYVFLLAIVLFAYGLGKFLAQMAKKKASVLAKKPHEISGGRWLMFLIFGFFTVFSFSNFVPDAMTIPFFFGGFGVIIIVAAFIIVRAIRLSKKEKR